MRIRIADNGIGFQPDKYLQEGGTSLGLEVMRQRVENLGGSFDISSTPATAVTGDGATSGTEIEISLPWDRVSKRGGAR